ncbi:MAG: hypothetical protein HXY40_13620 [Chloroflexi bacterium]|nr:hypothetical protein [Chloroflexota bacterium]
MSAVLRWIAGSGWLVLAGGADDEIRASALARGSSDGHSVYLSFGDDVPGQISESERLQEDLEDLGAGAGYQVDVLAEDDETLAARLADAGLVVISSSRSVDDLRSGLLGAAVKGMRQAYENGALIYAEGLGAAVFGAHVLLENGKLAAGLAWVEHALVVPGMRSVQQSVRVQEVLKSQGDTLAIGIAAGSALALGPAGALETWGAKQVTITLGSAYR